MTVLHDNQQPLGKDFMTYRTDHARWRKIMILVIRKNLIQGVTWNQKMYLKSCDLLFARQLAEVGPSFWTLRTKDSYFESRLEKKLRKCQSCVTVNTLPSHSLFLRSTPSEWKENYLVSLILKQPNSSIFLRGCGIKRPPSIWSSMCQALWRP